MERLSGQPTRLLAALLVAASFAAAQTYTISAKPGAVNYIEGKAFLNGNPVSDKELKSTFLNTNDTFSTEAGKAEILLTPGVFLRVGEDTEIRMVSPSLTDTKVEITKGEIMVEATGLVKDNNVQILDHGAIISLVKNGLYKFTADNPPTAAVLDGKAKVAYDERQVDIKKGRETILASNLPVQKFDTKQEDDLYAWSNVRSEYEAAASYRVSQNASLSAFSGAYGYGASGFGPGWYWDNGFNSYAWLPGNGAFFSPFGYGFYSPGLIGYAPVIRTSVYSGGNRWHGRNGGTPANGVTAAVPVSPNHPPFTAGTVPNSPWADRAARHQAAQAYAAANGGSFQGFRSTWQASHPNSAAATGATGGWHGNGGGAHANGGNGGGGWHGGGGGGGDWHGGGGAAGAGGGAHGGGGGHR